MQEIGLGRSAVRAIWNSSQRCNVANIPAALQSLKLLSIIHYALTQLHAIKRTTKPQVANSVQLLIIGWLFDNKWYKLRGLYTVKRNSKCLLLCFRGFQC